MQKRQSHINTEGMQARQASMYLDGFVKSSGFSVRYVGFMDLLLDRQVTTTCVQRQFRTVSRSLDRNSDVALVTVLLPVKLTIAVACWL